MPGQRKSTKLLADDELAQVQSLLGLPPIGQQSASSGTAGEQLPSWAATTDESTRKRLAKELTCALEACLIRDSELASRREQMDRLDLSELEAAGNAAKKAVSEVFSGWTDPVALVQATRVQREEHAFTASGPKANILDVTDPAAREKGGKPISGWDLAMYLAVNDRACTEVMARYKFDPYTGAADAGKFLFDEILKPFHEANKAALDKCDQFGYWMANPDLGLIFAPRYIEGWKRADGHDAKQVRDRKLEAYLKLIHEYIHTLQHPVVPPATGTYSDDRGEFVSSNTIKEGVCEYLTVKVINHLSAKSDDELDDIASETEDSKATGRGSALKARLKGYRPAYEPLVRSVNEAIGIMGGENGLLAAFFQGHTEYIGRTYGKWLAGALVMDGGARTIPAPAGFTTIEQLAQATGLSVEQITRANPSATAGGEPPEQVRLPGYHGHFVITDRGTGKEDVAVSEDWQMIARQHDGDADTIRRINQDPAEPPAAKWVLVPDA